MKKKGKVRKFFDIFLSIIMVFAILFAGIALYSKITGNQIIPYKMVWVLSESMEDTIEAKSFILIKKVDADDIKVDDIITFVSDDPTLNGNLNTHRVIEIVGDNSEFVTKGDNNVIKDNYTAKAENVVGVYVASLGVMTAFGRFFSTEFGFIVFCSIVMVVLVITLFIVNKQFKKIEMDKRVAEEVERLEKEHREEHKQ